mgnify:CR=1 FL=1
MLVIFIFSNPYIFYLLLILWVYIFLILSIKAIKSSLLSIHDLIRKYIWIMVSTNFVSKRLYYLVCDSRISLGNIMILFFTVLLGFVKVMHRRSRKECHSKVGKLVRWRRSHERWFLQFKGRWQKPWNLSEWIRQGDAILTRASSSRITSLKLIKWCGELLMGKKVPKDSYTYRKASNTNKAVMIANFGQQQEG